MFGHYLKIALRSLLKSKIYAAINIIGLAIGMACCLLIFLFVSQEWRYDRFHDNADQIYRVLSRIKSTDGSSRTVAIGPVPMAHALQAEYPEIDRAVRFIDFKGAVRHEGTVFTERLVFADPAIFEMFSFELVGANRAAALIAPTAVVVSAGTARKYFGDENALGGRRPTIIGVAENFHFRSLHNRIEPSVIMRHRGLSHSNILVRMAPDDMTGTVSFLRESWKKIAPQAPFEYYLFEEDVQRQYMADERWANIVQYAAVLAIAIASLGLFGLVALAASLRTKEIGVRKVLGATTGNVVALLSRDFVRLVLIANAIALPVAWMAMSRWLQNFAYRVDVSLWILLSAGLIALMIAAVTVGWQALRAAVANPVDSLRYE